MDTLCRFLDDGRNIIQPAVYIHLWCFQQTTNRLSKSLLSFHSLTECDTISYFENHSKRSSWNVFKEHHDLLENLGIGELTEYTVQFSETFVCKIYNVHSTDFVDSSWHILFSRTVKPEELSPTSDALRYHLMGVHYQAMMWRNAHYAIPNLPDPLGNGWMGVMEDFILFSCHRVQSLKVFFDVISCGCNKQCANQRCKCRKSEMRCKSMCVCHHQRHYLDGTPCMDVM